MGKHILQLGPVPPPEGGISRNILAIRAELRRRSHRCSIIATSRSDNPVPEEDVHHPRSPIEFARLLGTGEYDLIHTHIGGSVNNRTLAVAFAATVCAGKRSVFTLHSGGFPSTERARRAKRMSLPGAIFRRFGAVVSINDELTDVFARYGVDKSRIHHILPFAVGMPNPDVEVPDHLRGFAEQHDPFILSVGGLEEEYDPLFQIGAMESIRKEFPEAGLMMVGGGSKRDAAERLIAASPCGASIMLAGNVPHAVTLHLIARADVMLRATLFDGDAISVREALHLGTPVVATDNGMRPAGTRLIKWGSEEDLVARLREAVDNGRGPIGKAGDENIRAVADLYESLF